MVAHPGPPAGQGSPAATGTAQPLAPQLQAQQGIESVLIGKPQVSPLSYMDRQNPAGPNLGVDPDITLSGLVQDGVPIQPVLSADGETPEEASERNFAEHPEARGAEVLYVRIVE